MSGTIQRTDSIDSSGYPLAFKVSQGTQRPAVVRGVPGQDRFRVELRAMGGHQKEAVVTEGEGGSAFRSVSDEGPALNGSDLAPFPLGFMNAGLQADLQGRIMQLADARGIRIDALDTELLNAYLFVGSFFRGDGRGSAEAVRFKVRIASPAPAMELRALVSAAMDASPLVAMCRASLDNTFAFYVNGRRRPLATLPASAAPDAPDPLKSWKQAPAPMPSAGDMPEQLVKLVAAKPVVAAPVDPAATQRRGINVRGNCCWDRGTTLSEVTGSGSTFGIRSDERAGVDQAPSGLSLAAMGIAFCLSTQFLRYADHHKMNLRALRIVQDGAFGLFCTAAGGDLRGLAHPLDTHIFLHGEESDERMEKLLTMAQNTCYLHALVHGSLEPEVELEIIGNASAPG